MNTITKQDLEFILLSILVYDAKTNLPIGGLLKEKLSYKAKKQLQKLREEILGHFEELKKDIQDIIKEKEQDVNFDDKKELEDLMKEPITLTSEKPSLASIEAIESNEIYDYRIIEKITNAGN